MQLKKKKDIRQRRRSKQIVLVSLALLITLVGRSQNDVNSQRELFIRKNMVDVTIGGTGLFTSVNYSRILPIKTNHFIGLSAGIGTVIVNGGLSLPHQLTYNVGKKNSFMELGLGGVFWQGESNSSGYTKTINSYQICPIMGWRNYFQNNFVFRIYACPLFYVSGEYFIDTKSILPFAGISFGYTF